MHLKFILVAAAVVLISTPVSAHRAWIQPSATVLSGEEATVTVDAAISNTLFHPDHVAMSLDGMQVTGPTGDTVDIINAAKGRYRSVFDVELKTQGTYKIATSSGGLRAVWRDADGKRKMWPARGQIVSRNWRRVETFVTVGSPSKAALQPTNQGLELIPVTHPNDLYATETATFKLLFDGQPAAGAEIEVVPGGMRYRNTQQTIKIMANQQGELNITWPHAGMYFLEASYSDDNVAKPATVRQGNYSATFEVLPL